MLSNRFINRFHSGRIHITDRQYFCLTSCTCALSYTIMSLAAVHLLRLPITCKFQPSFLFIATFCCRLPYDSSCLGVLLLPAVNWTLAHFVALLHCIIVLVSIIFFYLRTEKLALRTMLVYYHIKSWTDGGAALPKVQYFVYFTNEINYVLAKKVCKLSAICNIYPLTAEDKSD